MTLKSSLEAWDSIVAKRFEEEMMIVSHLLAVVLNMTWAASSSKIAFLTMPNSTISWMNSSSRPWMASRIVISVSFGMIENGKQAISFGVFTQSESATQWIFAVRRKWSFQSTRWREWIRSHPSLVQDIEPPRSHPSNRWYSSNRDLPSVQWQHPPDRAPNVMYCNPTTWEWRLA